MTSSNGAEWVPVMLTRTTLKANAKDSTHKAKAKAKDLTFEGLNRELDI